MVQLLGVDRIWLDSPFKSTMSMLFIYYDNLQENRHFVNIAINNYGFAVLPKISDEYFRTIYATTKGIVSGDACYFKVFQI
jgi:hypothetical protein